MINSAYVCMKFDNHVMGLILVYFQCSINNKITCIVSKNSISIHVAKFHEYIMHGIPI